jgi:hypothetical protein
MAASSPGGLEPFPEADKGRSNTPAISITWGDETMKMSEIEAGFYYEKEGRSWLRLVVHVFGDNVTYADFAGFGQTFHFGRTVSRRLTAEEAARRFPDDVAKIAAVMAEPQYERLMLAIKSTNPKPSRPSIPQREIT